MCDDNELPLCPEEEGNIRWGGPMGDDEEDDDVSFFLHVEFSCLNFGKHINLLKQ